MELFNASSEEIDVVETFFEKGLSVDGALALVVHVHDYQFVSCVLEGQKLGECFVSVHVRSREVDSLLDVPLQVLIFFSHVEEKELGFSRDPC